MRHQIAGTALALFLAGMACAASRISAKDDAPAWDRASAARYLDAREQWWLTWPKSQRDHGTACISCHTAVPYAMARPSMRDTKAGDSLSPQEQVMLSYVTKRVDLWDQVEPFYKTEEKEPRRTEESRGTEAVLNALVLARYDSTWETRLCSPEILPQAVHVCVLAEMSLHLYRLLPWCDRCSCCKVCQQTVRCMRARV